MNAFSLSEPNGHPPPAGAAPSGAPPPPLPPRRRGCRRNCLAIGAVVAVSVVLLGLLALWSLAFFATRLQQLVVPEISGPVEFGEDEFPVLSEIWSAGHGAAKVVRVPLRGGVFLGDDHGWRGVRDDSADAALRAVRRATHDPEVAGLLLEIDSGGGGITASDILYDALLGFKRADTNRVIVAHMGNTALSGAYYICLAADHIVAHPTTVTGSIGVILASLNVRDLADKLGIRDQSVKSGGNKDLLNPLTDMSPEQRAMLQQLVDALHARFVALVVTQRELAEETVRELADGRIFLGPQAEALGLVDAVGYVAEAQRAVEALLGEEARFVRYSRRHSLQDLLRSPIFWGAVLSEAVPRADRHEAFRLH